jgi:hypothetical protein
MIESIPHTSGITAEGKSEQPARKKGFASNRLARILVATEIGGYRNGTSVLPSGAKDKLFKPAAEMMRGMATGTPPKISPMDTAALESLNPANGHRIVEPIPKAAPFRPPERPL